MDAPIPGDECERLQSLYALNLLDQGPNKHFDRFTRLVAQLLEVPISLVSLVDANRQWFGSRFGLDAFETPRCDAFCAHAILDSEVFVVGDARSDERFCDNPLVTGPPAIRFYAGAPIASPTGFRLGTLCAIDNRPRTLDPDQIQGLRDLADMVEREIAFAELALTDHLTGLANRRAFLEAGSRLLGLGQRRNEPVTVLYADIDGLKTVNDELGHGAGDKLLRRSAEAFRKALRESDLVARLGGDEMAVLLYDTDEIGAETVARKLQKAILRENAACTGPGLSISTGAATARPGETLASLVARADCAMYEVKDNGALHTADQ
jgi:diguanylate cyclase (GGDEF)-like protein